MYSAKYYTVLIVSLRADDAMTNGPEIDDLCALCASCIFISAYFQNVMVLILFKSSYACLLNEALRIGINYNYKLKLSIDFSIFFYIFIIRKVTDHTKRNATYL